MDELDLKECTPPYLYSVYGLNIASYLPCPELLLGTGRPDVTICYGTVPESLANARSKGICYQATPNQFLLAVDGVGRYLICNGHKLIIERSPHAEDEAVRLFLLGSVLGALLQQRGVLVLHGSAIVVNGRAVVFLGHSGMGKSTLSAAFSKKGYSVASDDLCAVTCTETEKPLLYPGFPQLKLWLDSCIKLGEDPRGLCRIRSKLEKYALPLQGFYSNPLPLEKLYVLTTTNIQKFELITLNGPEKFMALVNHTYRRCYLRGMDRLNVHASQCAMVAKKNTVIRVNRPSESFLLDELVERLEGDLQL